MGEFFQTLFTPENTWQLITALLGVVVVFLTMVANHIAGKYQKIVRESTDAIEAYRKGKSPESELGIKLSPGEKRDLKQETIDVIDATIKATTGGLLERGLLILTSSIRKLKLFGKQ